MKRIAIFSPYATVGPHFETELEVAQQHLDSGDAVDYVGCFGELHGCDFNPTKDRSRCQECIGRRQAGLLMLEPLTGCGSFDQAVNWDEAQLRFDFESVEDIKQYKVENFDIGYAALSSLVSLIRDPEPDFTGHKPTLTKIIQAAFQTYRFTLDYIRNHQPDTIYVFNGRFASMRAVLRACERTGTDCRIHERGCDTWHFEVFDNHLPHDIAAISKIIRRLWDQANQDPESSDFRERVAAQWFEDRVNRVVKSWHSFTTQQQFGLLPEGWNPDRKNVSIFCSSDDEFVAIGDQWQNDLYPNQVEAIERIAQSLLDTAPEIHLYLRVHPNLLQVENERKRKMMGLAFDNLTIIAPDAPIDTYELVRASDQVVSFGSSVGIEAVYWGKPSVLLGPCFYQDLEGPVRSKSHEHTIRLLSKQLLPGPRTGALMYGHWFQTRGQKFNYFEPTGLFEGKFKGQVIHAGMHAHEAGRVSLPKRISKTIFKRLLKAG